MSRQKKQGYVQVSVSIPHAMAHDLRKFADDMSRAQTVVLRRAIELVLDTPWTESIAMRNRERRMGTVSKPTWRDSFNAEANAPRPRVEATPENLLTTDQLDALGNLKSKLDPETGRAWYPLADVCDIYGVNEAAVRNLLPPRHQSLELDNVTWITGAWLNDAKDLSDLEPPEITKVVDGLADAMLRAEEAGHHITGPAVPLGT